MGYGSAFGMVVANGCQMLHDGGGAPDEKAAGPKDGVTGYNRVTGSGSWRRRIANLNE